MFYSMKHVGMVSVKLLLAVGFTLNWEKKKKKSLVFLYSILLSAALLCAACGHFKQM